VTDYADLEKRLRVAIDVDVEPHWPNVLLTEAADALASLRTRVLAVIEPFAEMGEGLTYDKDGVWRRRHHGRVDNLGRDVEITFTEGEIFERIAALKQDLSRAQPGQDETR